MLNNYQHFYYFKTLRNFITSYLKIKIEKILILTRYREHKILNIKFSYETLCEK